MVSATISEAGLYPVTGDVGARVLRTRSALAPARAAPIPAYVEPAAALGGQDEERDAMTRPEPMKREVPKKGIPKFDELMNPTLQALKRLGGSASIDELVPEIVKFLGLPQEVAEVPHGTTGRTELEYRAAWARTYLRNAGYVENSDRGIWALTPKGTQAESVDGRQIARDFARQFQAARVGAEGPAGARTTDEPEAPASWQDRLLSVLQTMDPTAFERLCQRILRESGFIEVEVTKRSGDGGIDGYGTIRLGGLMSWWFDESSCGW